MTGEPLIEGMLVGTEKDVLTTSETHQVHFVLSQLGLSKWTSSC